MRLKKQQRTVLVDPSFKWTSQRKVHKIHQKKQSFLFFHILIRRSFIDLNEKTLSFELSQIHWLFT